MKRLKQKKRDSTLKTLRRVPSKIKRIIIMGRKKVNPLMTEIKKVLEVLYLQNNKLLIGSINAFKVTTFLTIFLGIRLLIVKLRKE